MLDDVLADFRQRHRETHGDLSVEVQVLYQCILRPLLDLVDDLVDVVAFGDGSHFKKHARFGCFGGFHAPLKFVELCSVLEEIHPGPVAADVLRLGDV